MQKSQLSLQLIRNSYEPKEAKEVILKLLSDKVQFIECQAFSLEERFGIESPFLENRLRELESAKRELIAFIENIEDEDVEIKIDCPINIELVKSNFTSQTAQENNSKEWI